MASWKELRRHDRVNTVIEATFGDGQGMYVDAVVNLSLGGACVECRMPIEEEKEITLIIPSNPAVKISATIKWCKKNGLKHRIGMEFKEISPDQKRALNEFIGNFFWERAM